MPGLEGRNELVGPNKASQKTIYLMEPLEIRIVRCVGPLVFCGGGVQWEEMG